MKQRMNFQKKIFLYYSIVVVTLIITIFSAFYLYVYRTITEDIKNNLDKLSEALSVQTDNLFSNMDKLALYVSTNPQLRKSFNIAMNTDITNHELEMLIMETLSSASVPNSNSEFRISVYNQRGNFVSTGISYDRETVTKLLCSTQYIDWYNQLPTRTNQRFITSAREDFWSESTEKYISLFREIYNIPVVTSNTAVIEIQCRIAMLEDILKSNRKDFCAYIYTEKGELVYPLIEDTQYVDSLYNQYKTKKRDGNHTGTFDKDLYAGVESDYTGWVLILTQPRQQIMVFLTPLMLMAGFLGLFMLIVGICTIFLISNRITKPLKTLRESVHAVTMVNLSLEINNFVANDEFSELNYAFDKMFERLKTSMDEIVEIKTHEIKAHMIALQAQMEPHFLYNIIAVIKAMSRETGNDNIGRVCDYLAGMLRYTTSFSNGEVSVASELEHIENYLKLMKVRFEDQFEYSFEIDRRVKNIEISKLLLHPLIENCFHHGFKEKLPPWQIDIRCWVDSTKWYFSVSDNGLGFSDEIKKELLNKIDFFLQNPSENITHLKLGGMGLINTIVRLNLKNKGNVIFEINNLQQGGTSITIGGFIANEYSVS